MSSTGGMRAWSAGAPMVRTPRQAEMEQLTGQSAPAPAAGPDTHSFVAVPSPEAPVPEPGAPTEPAAEADKKAPR